DVVHAQTALAIMALNRHADEASKAVLAKALAYAATNKLEPAGLDIGPPATREEGLKIAVTLLGKRNKDGVWDGPRGPVIETARALCAINAVAPLLSGKSESRPAASLPKLEEADRAKALAALQRGADYLASQA